MEQHEENECKYKPARCPSLTCPIKPAFANLLKHIEVAGYHIDTIVFMKQMHIISGTIIMLVK